MNRQKALQKYQAILLEYFEKVKKNLPKTYPSFRDFLNKMKDLIKCENMPKLGKHMVIFRLTINMRQPKLTQLALTTLSKLVSFGFVDGRIEDTSQEYYTEEFAELFKDSNYDRGDRRTIMDALINSVTSCLIDKEEIIVPALKLLVAFVLNPFCNVHSSQLTKIIKTIIYAFTRNQTFNQGSKSQTVDRNAKSMLYQIINYTFQAVEGDIFIIQRNKRKMSIKEDAVQNLTQLVLSYMVDLVCLGKTELTMKVQPQILNEKMQPAGLFGYCLMCRNTANLYCKDNRVPICSFNCKRLHMERVEQVQNTYNGATKQFYENLHSALQLYESLCKLLANQINLQQPKNQQIVLESLLYILETPDFILSTNEKFIKITKDSLCNQLLKYCLEIEKTIYQFSFRIFQRLVNIMRKELKQEIAIFINQIYLNILLSVNSTYLHKQTALESLCIIIERPKTGLEFYINYDCHTKHECLMTKIIETLHDIIVKSIYQKQEYQIQPQYEVHLKQLAITALSSILDGLNKIFEQYITTPQEECSTPLLEDITENNTVLYINPIEIQRQLKQEIMKGTQIFKKNPEKGIKFLLDAGVLQNDPKEIAKFLRETTQINKDSVGEYLGGHHPLNIRVLSEYTDMLRFKDLTVEQALRYYLDQFTLPGESQQVDRVVEKFSDRYFQENPNSLFKSSSSIYTFTYLLVMLQTDLHNPQVVEKMKLTDFSKLARQINDGDDLPQEYLTQTYLSIQKEPLALREKEKNRIFMRESLTQSIRKKQDLFQREKEALLKQGSQLIRNQSDTYYTTINQDMAYLIKPLLESIGKQAFEMLSVGFQQDLSDVTSSQCIQGLLLFIKLCSFFSIPLQDYMNAIIKATKLNQLTLITTKHIQLIKKILQTVPLIGNGLRESGWRSILAMLSRLDEMRNLQQTKDTGDVQIIGVLPELLFLESDLIDKAFIQSRQLDDEAIQEFIIALCAMSKQEIFQTSPRLFCLQKLVEVSDHNMQRVNFVWTKLWNIVRDHIVEVATKEKRVAIYTVDSLKQLNIKFLQKDELYNFQFQREVLKPFETIFTQTDSEVKEFILSCINHIVLNNYSNIRSGWKVIFGLINLGLKEEEEKVYKIAFSILSRIIEHNLDLIQDVFSDLITSLKVLSQKVQEEMALRAVDFTISCLNYLSRKAQIIPKVNWEEQDEIDITVRNVFTVQQLESYWIPLLGLLAGLAGDRRSKVQCRSMDTLFELLQQFGYAFSADFWKMVFSIVLRPIFDEIQFTFQQSFSNEDWFKGSCKKAFSLIINLLKRYYQKLGGLLQEFLKLFENCIQNQNVKLTKYSIVAAKNMVMKIGAMFDADEWQQIVNFLDRMIRLTTPGKLLAFSSISPLTQSRMRTMQEECSSQCSAQLLIIQISIEILKQFNLKLNLKQLEFLEQTFNYSYTFALSFNQQIEQRYTIWKQGLVNDIKYLPGLLKQEREAYGCMIIIQKIKMQNHSILDLESLTKPIELFIEKNELIRSMPAVALTTNEDYDQQIKRLKIQEIEREVLNYKQLLDVYIIPCLSELSDEQVLEYLIQLKSQQQKIFKLLVRTITYTVNPIICKECQHCQKCLQQEKSTLDQQIQRIVQRLYDLK